MSLVYAGVLSHAPGITGRADLVENVAKRDEFYANLDAQRQQIEDAGTEALIVIAAEHFGNFFMNNMPAYCMGIGETRVDQDSQNKGSRCAGSRYAAGARGDEDCRYGVCGRVEI
jgi:hypothetical protein